MTSTPAHAVRNLIIGTSLTLLSSTGFCFAQSQSTPLEPTLENARGTWELDLSIRKSQVSPRHYVISAENLTADASSQAESVKGWSIRTAKLLRDMAKKGGQKESSFAESFKLIVKSQKEFFIEQRSFGGHTSRHERAETEQRLFLKDYRARRTDTSVGKGEEFTIDNPNGSYTKCFFITEWRMHANLVNYCRVLGEDTGDGVRSIPVTTLRREPPVGVPLFRHEHHLMMRSETIGAGRRYTTSMFDKQGRVSREWQSVWINGLPVRLNSKTLLPATQTVSSSRSVKVKNRAPGETTLPTFAQLTAIPFDRTECLDKRGDMDGAFDPRKGIPAKPHTMADYKARRDAERAKEVDTTIKPRTVAEVRPTIEPVVEHDEADDAAAIPARLEVLPHESNWLGAAMITGLVALLSMALLLVVRGRRGRHVNTRDTRGTRPAQVVTLSVLLIALGVFCASCGTARNSGSQLVSAVSGEVEMTPYRIDVPKADSRTPHRQQLDLSLTSNLGYEAEIVRTISSCGCLQLKIPKKTIAPFGTVPVKAEFVTGRLSRVLVQVHWRCRDKTGICEARVVQSNN